MCRLFFHSNHSNTMGENKIMSGTRLYIPSQAGMMSQVHSKKLGEKVTNVGAFNMNWKKYKTIIKHPQFGAPSKMSTPGLLSMRCVSDQPKTTLKTLKIKLH